MFKFLFVTAINAIKQDILFPSRYCCDFIIQKNQTVSEAEVLSQDGHEIPLFPCTPLALGRVKVTSSSLSIWFSLSLSILTKMSVSTWRLKQDRALSAADYV